MEVKYVTYLLNRNGIYYFHYRIPKAIKHRYKSKTFIRVSLKTTCRNEALKRAKILWVSIVNNKRPSNEEIENREAYYDDLYERGKVLSKKWSEIDEHSSYQQEDFFSNIGTEGYTADFDKKALQHFDDNHYWEDGKVYEKIKRRPVVEKELYLRDLADKFIEDKERGQAWSVRSSKEQINIIATIIELCGNVTCRELTENLINNKFSDNLQKIPVHTSKKPAYLDSNGKRKSIYECIKIAEKNNLKTISYRTQKKYVTLFRSLLNWGENRKLVSQSSLLALNFFKTIKDKTPKKEKNYTLQELKELFHHTDFLEGKYHYNYPERHWGQLLALYTGARANEIAQILTKDIQCEDGIHYINIKDEENQKRLKTESSKRVVPIHDHIINLGFLEYCKYQEIRSNKLFPRCEPDKTRETYHRKLTGWYRNNHLENLKNSGLIEKHKNFHSFRHTFINRTNQLILQEKIVNEIVGHDLGRTKAQETYRNSFPLDKKYEEINKISFDLDLSKIKVWQTIR